MRRMKTEERGQGLVEYALILALVSLAAIVALGFLSGKINDLFSKAGNTLNTVQVAGGASGGGTSTSGSGGGVGPSYVSGGAITCPGTCNTGEQATAAPGTWNGSPAPTFSYQWKRSATAADATACNFSSANWGNVGTNSPTFTLGTADGGIDAIGVRVTATNATGSASHDVCVQYQS